MAIGSKKAIPSIYIAGILTGLSVAFPAYITSTFLSQFVPEKLVGLLYALASAVAILFFIFIPLILRKIGNFKFTLGLIAVSLLSILGMAFVKHAAIIPILFVVYFLYTVAIYLCLDIFLEHHSENKTTGSTRGAYLAMSNGAWIVAQIAIGFILTDSDYWKIFLLSAIMMLFVSIMVARRFKDFRDPDYDEIKPTKDRPSILKNKDLLGILSASFLLQLFFSWMVIYTPIYLHEHIGFSWSQIGWIFSVMLLPFVITEYPLGKIADKKLGEKELLIGGFAIMAITSTAMTFITAPKLWLWMTVLFLSRIGASTVEAMTETYFFKKVSASDASYLSLFRTTKPWAYIIGPASATLFLFFYDLQFLFSALALIMIAGIFSTLTIKDTR